MTALLIPVIGVGAWLALSDDEKTAHGAVGLSSQPLVHSGALPSVAGKNVIPATTVKSRLAVSSKLGAVNPYVSAGAGRYTNQGALTAAAEIAKAEARAKAEYNKLSAEAKRKGAAALSSKLGISPPLTGQESWAELGKKVGGVAGAAACGSIPGGAIAIPLCSIVGAYLGAKLSDWLSGQYGKISTEIEDTYGDAKAAVIDAAGDVYEEISSWW